MKESCCFLLCSFRAENPTSHHAATCAWTTCSCLRPARRSGALPWLPACGCCRIGSLPRLCTQGCHNFFCLPSFLGPVPPILSQFLLTWCLGAQDRPCLPTPCSCLGCRPSLLPLLVSQILCSPLP